MLDGDDRVKPPYSKVMGIISDGSSCDPSRIHYLMTFGAYRRTREG